MVKKFWQFKKYSHQSNQRSFSFSLKKKQLTNQTKFIHFSQNKENKNVYHFHLFIHFIGFIQ